MLAVPLCGQEGRSKDLSVRLEQSMILRFKFPDEAELGQRLRLDCYWDIDAPTHHESLHFPSDDGSVIKRVLSISKEVNWKGSIREYMIWRRYVANYVRRETC